jgi:hypothetical protein
MKTFENDIYKTPYELSNSKLAIVLEAFKESEYRNYIVENYLSAETLANDKERVDADERSFVIKSLEQFEQD